jgi:hypothetical protein
MNTMRMNWLRGGILLAAAALPGCGSSQPAAAPAVAEEPGPRLPQKADVNLADWLSLPRAELARRAQDAKETVDRLQNAAATGRDSVALLPRLMPALSVPVFREARFSEQAGFSLPPYLAESTKDPDLALHLARHGDTEAAQKLADPADQDLLKKIEGCRGQRNYPLEWARLVALAAHAAQLRLANGEVDGAAELVQMHKQLRELLDDKAAAGPLGAALLPAGRRALREAAAAWRGAGKKTLADDVDAALAAWGDVPPPAPLVSTGAPGTAVARAFHAPAYGRTIPALGANAGRAFDLLALPVPSEGLAGVVGFLDAGDRLAELLVLYQPRTGQAFPEPVHLAHHLVEHGYEGGAAAQGYGVARQAYQGGGLVYEVTVVPRGTATGGLVRVHDGTHAAPVTLPADSRDFGAAHLDHTFEQNRLALAPELKSADTLEVTQRGVVARVTLPGLGGGPRKDVPPAAAVVLRRLGSDNLLEGLALRWTTKGNETSLSRLAVPLWASFGRARVEGGDDANGGHLALTWEDDRTRFTLRLPHNLDQAPEFHADDRAGSAGAAGRQAEALALDQAQRKRRLEEGKPLARLPRAVPDVEPFVALGMERPQALARLRKSPTIRQATIPGGVSRLYQDAPPERPVDFPTQSFVRFGPDDRVAEIRVRYSEPPRPKDDRRPGLLARLSAAPCGAPDVLPPEWAAVWADLPPQRPAPALYRWLDDRTLMTLQRDAGGAELTLRDCPPDEPLGVSLPPLQFCGRGVDGCALGDRRADVLARWKGADSVSSSDGGLVLAQPPSSPYEAVVAYFDGDAVSRILGYHRAGKPLQRQDVPAAFQEAWARDLDRLGAVRRQEAVSGLALPALGWHDDRTRVRTFAQETDQGPRLFTEWREWAAQPPAPAPQRAAAR